MDGKESVRVPRRPRLATGGIAYSVLNQQGLQGVNVWSCLDPWY
jgi:hypothetical protein